MRCTTVFFVLILHIINYDIIIFNNNTRPHTVQFFFVKFRVLDNPK